MGQIHHLVRVQLLQAVVAPDLPPAPSAGQAVAQAQHVAGDGGPQGAVRVELAHHVITHRGFHVVA